MKTLISRLAAALVVLFILAGCGEENSQVQNLAANSPATADIVFTKVAASPFAQTVVPGENWVKVLQFRADLRDPSRLVPGTQAVFYINGPTDSFRRFRFTSSTGGEVTGFLVGREGPRVTLDFPGSSWTPTSGEIFTLMAVAAPTLTPGLAISVDMTGFQPREFGKVAAGEVRGDSFSVVSIPQVTIPVVDAQVNYIQPDGAARDVELSITCPSAGAACSLNELRARVYWSWATLEDPVTGRVYYGNGSTTENWVSIYSGLGIWLLPGETRTLVFHQRSGDGHQTSLEIEDMDFFIYGRHVVPNVGVSGCSSVVGPLLECLG